MNNELFRILIGIIIFGIIIFIIFRILKEGFFAWHGKDNNIEFIDKKGKYNTIHKSYFKNNKRKYYKNYKRKYYRNYRKYKKY